MVTTKRAGARRKRFSGGSGGVAEPSPGRAQPQEHPESLALSVTFRSDGACESLAKGPNGRFSPKPADDV
eukprot:154653-Alexandrium_andersonii.AAC.1